MSTFLNASPIFGPVRSRRLGVSLGVNMMPAEGKICSFDCLYCENGFNAERVCGKKHNSAELVAAELEAKLREMGASGELPDVITFAGNGEPTAAPGFPEAIRRAVALRDELAPKAKIAVLSNGTYAARPEVHDALMLVDDNILKLDTVDAGFIQLLDRPVGPYDVERQIEAFAAFEGHVIVQTIFLCGEYEGTSCDNTGEQYVGPWLAALERIKPQAATIYTIARETPASGLQKAPAEALDAIAARVRALGIPCQVSY
ncbi:radical SAM protein [Paratractidigestivibacter sp.]|uniref:radical SAM protein n=1 Tax=Paratractidigestivibacter sp. TaxID=2847316 RepID=UPI002ABE72F4|nr:radical SAM protein [Paratractidigestivibacter sp.]